MNITLDLRMADLQDVAVHRLRQTIPRVGPDDELTILVNSIEAHETDNLVDELKKQGFDFQPKGADGTTYNITAKRLYH